MIVRKARSSDVSEVSALEAELFDRDAWSPRTVGIELAHPLHRSVVAVVGESVVGYAILFVVADAVDLHRIGVSLHHQRRGVAHALLSALELDTYPRVLLEVHAHNRAAITLYESTGFTAVATRRAYYADGSDALVMQRDSSCPAAVRDTPAD